MPAIPKLTFSQRTGLKPVRDALQVRAIDAALRNRLWNAVSLYFLAKDQGNFELREQYPDFHERLSILWHDFFREPVDTIPVSYESTIQHLRAYFFKAEWNEVFDFLEALCPVIGANRAAFMRLCNSILEEELSAYRFVNDQIVQLTSQQEIDAIEQAINVPNPLKPVKAHLERALGLLADRANPDYRNSIKESISAVESLCKLLSGQAKTTLGPAMDALEKKVPLHPALKEAFKKLYNYTSDAQGIRHALLDEPTLTFADAKFMLVSCSAFVNYVVELCAKAGVKL